MQIRGIIPPVATPMQANEDLDLPRLKSFIDHLIANGVHGIFVLGTNSEFYALDEREKQEVIATAVAHVNKRVPVYAGTGAETTREAVRLTQLAEREGADVVSVITPYFVQPTQQEMFDHFRRVAEATRLPVLLYVNPVMYPAVEEGHGLVRTSYMATHERQHLDRALEVLRKVGRQFGILVGAALAASLRFAEGMRELERDQSRHGTGPDEEDPQTPSSQTAGSAEPPLIDQLMTEEEAARVREGLEERIDAFVEHAFFRFHDDSQGMKMPRPGPFW